MQITDFDFGLHVKRTGSGTIEIQGDEIQDQFDWAAFLDRQRWYTVEDISTVAGFGPWTHLVEIVIETDEVPNGEAVLFLVRST